MDAEVNVKYLEVVSTRREEFPVLPPFVKVGVNVKYLEVVSTSREESLVFPLPPVDAGVNVKYLEIVSARREESPVLLSLWMQYRSKCEVPGGSKYQEGGVSSTPLSVDAVQE